MDSDSSLKRAKNRTVAALGARDTLQHIGSRSSDILGFSARWHALLALVGSRFGAIILASVE